MELDHGEELEDGDRQHGNPRGSPLGMAFSLFDVLNTLPCAQRIELEISAADRKGVARTENGRLCYFPAVDIRTVFRIEVPVFPYAFRVAHEGAVASRDAAQVQDDIASAGAAHEVFPVGERNRAGIRALQICPDLRRIAHSEQGKDLMQQYEDRQPHTDPSDPCRKVQGHIFHYSVVSVFHD